MRWKRVSAALVVLSSAMTTAQAQYSGESDSGGSGPAVVAASPDSILNWTPPSLSVLGKQAEARNSFVLDRTMLGAVAALLPQSDAQAKPAIRKLDCISVHLYRFHDAGEIDPAALEQVRQAYNLRGWKHLVSGNAHGDPDRKTTDIWMVLDGIEVRGGTMMVVTPRTVSLVTFTGDLSPVDMMHLRGHFGIPAASDDRLSETR